ncbi:MAG: DUF1722 domain-containing protein [Proteobacteria bacterium]|nr:DUF1722 domain-containing protein [Pseudomonadota bacterium]
MLSREHQEGEELEHCERLKQLHEKREKQERWPKTVPLIVPIRLINHSIRKHHQHYLKEQYYLHPHPLELQLRNHV